MAYERSRSLLGETHPDTLDAMDNYASALEHVGAGARQWSPPHWLCLVIVCEGTRPIAQSLPVAGRNIEAVAVQAKNLELTKALYGDNHPTVATTLHNYALKLMSAGAHASACCDAKCPE